MVKINSSDKLTIAAGSTFADVLVNEIVLK